MAREALALAKTSKPIVIDYTDPEFAVDGERLGSIDYEQFIASGDPEFDWQWPADEWEAISLNYTSGTTGNPKGVVYHHRGAYLLAQGNVLTASMPKHPVYLWTLPMFHCNGWCFPWSHLGGGRHSCHAALGALQGDLGGARRAQGDASVRRARSSCRRSSMRPPKISVRSPQKVEFFTAAAPPPEAVLAAMAEAGFNVTHLYGLTETYGPAVVNDWKVEWDELASPARAAKKARQGVRYHALEDLTVLDPETMLRVPADGTTMGEVMFRGNIVMKGYLKNPKAMCRGLPGRLVPFRRSRRLARGRLHPAQGPLQGHHHLGRREHFIDRGGGRALQAPGGAGRRRGRQARREMGRDAMRVHRIEARQAGDRSRRSSTGARRASPNSRCQSMSCSRNCRRRAPGRSRSSSYASGRRTFDG